MRMLDAFGNVGRRRKSAGSSMFLLGAFAVLCLGAAIPIYGADPRQEGTGLADFKTNGGTRAGDTLTMVEGTLARLKFSRPLASDQEIGAKIADSKVAMLQPISVTELVVTALKVGRTNLLVRFKEGDPEVYEIVVHRDLSVLEGALKGIHPTIEVQSAPDRNALILTGTVPDSNAASRAQQAALDFAQASGADGKVINLIRVQTAATSIEASLTNQVARMGAPDVAITRIQKGPITNDAEDIFIISGSVPNLMVADNVTDMVRATIGDDSGKKSRVVSQITVGGRPSAIENMLERAIQEQLGQTGVKVSRVVGTDSEGDNDILILTGTVANQTALIRVLTLSAKVFQQQALVKRKRDGEYTRITETYAGGLTRTTDTPLKLSDISTDIRVAADESGALFTNEGERGDRTGTNSALRSVLGTRNGGFSGSGSTGLGGLVENRLDSNLARATAIELAEGRILSFIQVTDIPQVRVSIRFFEISRNDLLNWDSNVSKIGVADFDTNGINPNTPLFGANDTIVNNANGDPILFASNTDIANVVSFLEGGFTNQILIGGEHFNLDAVLNVLETESVARTLASPTLTVLSGEVAAFGDGGSVSVTSSISTPVGVNDGDLGVFQSVQQLPFGIQLAVRPLVGEDGYITLDVAPSVSNPDFALTALVRTTTGTPQETVAFAERNVRTTARLRDGEVLLIGGLQDRTRKDEAGKTPFLAQIPILGWLFQDKKFEDKDREVMVTVNPTIVRDRPTQARLWSYPGMRELLRRDPPPPPAAEPVPATPPAQPVPASTPAKKPAGQ